MSVKVRMGEWGRRRILTLRAARTHVDFQSLRLQVLYLVSMSSASIAIGSVAIASQNLISISRLRFGLIDSTYRLLATRIGESHGCSLRIRAGVPSCTGQSRLQACRRGRLHKAFIIVLKHERKQK